jgi:ribosomal protein S12 methylthiotransferase
MKGNKIFLISLGCPRNLVDSEYVLTLLKKNGFDITEVIEEAGIAIVNTCGFIKEAKEESIDVILNLVSYKSEGNLKKIIVGGCLTQRYSKEIFEEFKEIDAVLGINWADILKLLNELFKKEKRICLVRDDPLDEFLYLKKRSINLTPFHFAYLKISEGCNNRCSYCAIYNIKGPLHSRKIEDILDEAHNLIENGVKEINIVAQDTTSYGKDIYGESKLGELLKSLNDIKGDFWIRLLYTHPAHIDDSLINAYRELPKLCKYIDIPLQHINNNILKKMRRKITKEEIIELLTKIRKNIPDIAIRTTFIVGFPQETDEQFRELLGFIKEMKFERLGAFIYSQEDKTDAYKFKRQIPESVKRERFDKLMKLQEEIAKEINLKQIGKIHRMLIDEERDGFFYARTQYDAPEVDGLVYIKKNGRYKVGNFVTAKIEDSFEYDLLAKIL